MATTRDPNPNFSPSILGQAEKALNAILLRHLAGTGLTEPQWVALTLIVLGGGTVGRDEMVGRVAGALKVDRRDAGARIAELGEAELVTVLADADADADADAADAATPVAVTEAGAKLYRRIRGAVTEITQRMWGDLPAEDLDTAGRVLGIVLARANAELAGV